jgi:drug/metabolite transporter (DMT)-like permease
MSDLAEEIVQPGRLGTAFTQLLIEAALILCWSSGFVGVRFATVHAAAITVLFWRSLGSAVLLLIFAMMVGRKLSVREIFPQLAIGALAMSGYLAGFALAIAQGVPTGLVALIADMLPMAVAALSWPILGQILNRYQWSGFLIGLVGVLIASGSAIQIGHAPLWSYGLPALGMISLAVATLLQKRLTRSSMPVHQALCLQSFAAAAIFAGFAGWNGELAPPADWSFALGIIWLIVFATFGGYGLYYFCLRRSSPARVSSVLYLSPPVTMVWAWAMFGEALSWQIIAGLFISLCGTVIVAKSSA